MPPREVPGLSKESTDAFNSFFTEDARKGDIYDIIYAPGEGVNVYIKGQTRAIPMCSR